ncbi:FAD-binding oxidoreductase [Microlunatus elymi]|uniref:FAD-binding oxidoreductase n=1 Tax=Microlunatus elymi TaxID=2596828 RepID=A0A516Q5S3_9ACTN|nr:FAD-binding oxidoreductase [Microlunatus elymi]QDP98783.1 FAD-binding oxidoreductase [Microlunatus elymi]
MPFDETIERANPTGFFDTEDITMSIATIHRPGSARTIDRGALLPGSAEYAAARARIVGDQYPAAIVEAASTADVQRAVITADRLGVPLTVRGTGHGSVAGVDGRLLLSTAAMTGVAVDPWRQVARIRAGARWSAVIAAAASYGLSPTSGDFPGVGVVGFTTGGGVGWLSRKYGYAADNLVSADLVTADGRLITASADDHDDLFWAVRGGSGNFGVITELEIALAPVSRVLSGTVNVPIDRAADFLRWFGDHADQVPDELTLAPTLRRSVDDHGPQLAIGAVWAGDVDYAAGALRVLRRVTGVDFGQELRSMPYAKINIPGTPPRGFELYDGLDEELIRAVIDAVAAPDGEAQALEFRHWGGATARPGIDHGPVGHRDVPFSIKINAEPATVDRLADSATGKQFLNFLADPSRTRTAYRITDYYRLRELKRRYDPANLLRPAHNILPA